jgi:TonB-dependent starch-binding outer membrane protein SusC
MTSTWKSLALPLLFGALGVPLAAQQQPQSGAVVGRVVDRNTGQPVAEANVVIVGSTRGARTSEQGRYRVAGVPAGTHQVRVTRLGYAAETRPATVTPGQEVSIDFQVGPTAVQIDEVVVTATGETQRRRETGNAVSVVQPTAQQLATTTNIAQVLTAAAPGVYVNSPGGTVGSANRIRIRGANSISLSNEPLLIIDGVRASNQIVGSGTQGTIGVGGQQSSRLNDINPDDIESIEVLKGPAAAALYGTAAASGVIQIRTKRGRPGRTQWTTYAEAGSQEDVTTYPANFAQVGRLTSSGNRTTGCTLDAQTRNLCTPVADSLVSYSPLATYSPFITGYRSSFGLNVAGGGDVASYYVSGDYDNDHGIFRPNEFRRASLRANTTAQLRDNLNLQASTNYISSRLTFPQNDNNVLGVYGGGLLGSAFDVGTSHGYLAGQTPTEIFAIDTHENVERFVGSATSTWQITKWLSMNGTTGVDFFDRRNRETVPPNRVFFGSLPEGQRIANATQIWNYTANVSATGAADIRPELRSQTTVGMQFTQEQIQSTRAFGAKLLAGTGSLQGTAARFAVGETNTDNRTLGALISEQLAYRDRLFLTLAGRTDKNSAFGQNFGWSFYPAASLSYVISEEAFFPKIAALSSLRLRGAYGVSGQRPNFRDAITFFETQTVTVNATDVPGIQIAANASRGGTGNPDLRPELSREWEAGFESGFFGSRVGLDMTYYNKRTTDALVERPLPPSLGLTLAQWDNLGITTNRGFEFQFNAQLFNRPLWNIDPVRFDLTISGSTNKNRLVDLGELPNGDPIPPIVFGNQQHVNGYPLGGYWDEGITFEDKNGDGKISRVNCPGQTQIAGGPECEITITTNPDGTPRVVYLGNPLPTREFAFAPRLTLWTWLELSALVDYKGGFKQFNNTERFRCNFGNCRAAYDPSASLSDQARNLGQLLGTDAGYVEDASFTKLRELSVSLTAPRSLAAQARVQGLRLTVAARNLKTWANYSGFDPEVNSTPSNLFSQSDFLTAPPLRIVSARLTVQF